MQRSALLSLVCAGSVLVLSAAHAEIGINKLDKNQLLQTQSAQVEVQADFDGMLESLKQFEFSPAIERLEFVRTQVSVNPKLTETSEATLRILGLQQALIIEHVNGMTELSGPERLRRLQQELEPLRAQREAIKATIEQGGSR